MSVVEARFKGMLEVLKKLREEVGDPEFSEMVGDMVRDQP